MKCSFCDRVFPSIYGVKAHEGLCPNNPNRREHPRGTLGKKGKNQFTKAKENGLPPPKISEETRKKIGTFTANRMKNDGKVVGEKIRKTIEKKVLEGTWHTSLAKKMHHNYNGVDLHGKWEVFYAEYLDSHSIKWERCKVSFEYTFEGKKRRYTPDFYLVDSDEYVEIKGYKTEKDLAKWSQFPKKLIILTKIELSELLNMKLH